jgi:16S rRNA (guanine1207-N2)-methyltransferase
MTRHRKSDPKWRSEAAAEVMADCVQPLALGSRVLVAGEAAPVLQDALKTAGRQMTLWLRRASPTGAATAWPVEGPYSAALIRLPRAKDELDMLLHAAAAQVSAGGVIAVYGANDEGIRSAATRIEPLLGAAETVDQRAHCRVIVARRPADIAGLRSRLDDWQQTTRMTIGSTEHDWVSYPGVFAKGCLDDGTRLLVGVLASSPAPARVLDYGCGTGVIAAHVQRQFPDATIEMADWDALALVSARENVPGTATHIVSALADLGVSTYDLIVSNPPIHDGKSEDYTVLGQLIAQAPARLTPKGQLMLVVQRRVPVAEWLSAAFGKVEKAAEDTRFCVWRASLPKSTSPKARKKEPKAKRTGRLQDVARP